jgi:hypothetical protein
MSAAAPRWRQWLISPQPRAPWVWLMALLTGAYLLVECGFNARLLDVVGGMPDPDAVHEIERYGRSLSGLAAALMFWPWLLKRDWHPLRIILALAALTGVLGTTVYVAEQRLVDHFVDRSSAGQRYLAANLVVLQNALVSRGVTLDELPLTPEQMSQPDGKTFLAVFPLLALSSHDLDQILHKQKPLILRAVAEKMHGGADQSYDHFITARKALIDTYNDGYVSASAKYQNSLAGVAEQQRSAWDKYTARLRKSGTDPDHLPPAYWPKARKEVQKLGVKVASDWDPSDRASFDRAVAQRVRSDSDAAFRNGMAARIKDGGDKIPPGLDQRSFFSHPAVQRAWRKQLGYGDAAVMLPLELPPQAQAPQYFRHAIYDKVIASQVQDLLRRYDAPVAAFGDGGSEQKFGRDQMRALVAPPIALCFSIVGALIHLIKLALFLLQLATGRGFTYALVKGVCVPLLAFGLLASFHGIQTSEITANPLYRYLEQRGERLGGDAPGWEGKTAMFFTRCVIHAQVPAYPMFEAVRLHVLGGYEFGYSPGAKPANSGTQQ